MAIPEGKETERNIYLRNIVEATDMQEVLAWENPNDEDLALFGRIISLYSMIDFMLRFTAEIMDDNGMLEGKYAGKKQAFSIASVIKAIRSSPMWTENQNIAFDMIEIHRRARNIVAHFIIKRFPKEDAYICMTKSAADFEQVFGKPPELEQMLFGVLDGEQARGIVPEIKRLVKWTAQLPGSLSNPLKPDI